MGSLLQVQVVDKLNKLPYTLQDRFNSSSAVQCPGEKLFLFFLSEFWQRMKPSPPEAGQCDLHKVRTQLLVLFKKKKKKGTANSVCYFRGMCHCNILKTFYQGSPTASRTLRYPGWISTILRAPPLQSCYLLCEFYASSYIPSTHFLEWLELGLPSKYSSHHWTMSFVEAINSLLHWRQ